MKSGERMRDRPPQIQVRRCCCFLCVVVVDADTHQVPTPTAALPPDPSGRQENSRRIPGGRRDAWRTPGGGRWAKDQTRTRRIPWRTSSVPVGAQTPARPPYHGDVVLVVVRSTATGHVYPELLGTRVPLATAGR